jgi:hypothetical protein
MLDQGVWAEVKVGRGTFEVVLGTGSAWSAGIRLQRKREELDRSLRSRGRYRTREGSSINTRDGVSAPRRQLRTAFAELEKIPRRLASARAVPGLHLSGLRVNQMG